MLAPIPCRVRAIGELTWNLLDGYRESSEGKHLKEGKNVTMKIIRMEEVIR